MKNLTEIFPFILNEELINKAITTYNVIRSKNIIKLFEIKHKKIIAYWYYFGYCKYTNASYYLKYILKDKKYELYSINNNLNCKYMYKGMFLKTEQELKDEKININIFIK